MVQTYGHIERELVSKLLMRAFSWRPWIPGTYTQDGSIFFSVQVCWGSSLLFNEKHLSFIYCPFVVGFVYANFTREITVPFTMHAKIKILMLQNVLSLLAPNAVSWYYLCKLSSWNQKSALADGANLHQKNSHSCLNWLKHNYFRSNLAGECSNFEEKF